MRFFFYGTLMDEEVRRAVLGSLAPSSTEPARLEGWRRIAVAGASYPIIVRRGRRRVEGVLARGLDRQALPVLAAYEGKEFAAIALPVRTRAGRRLSARVFVPAPGTPVGSAGGWDLALWQRRHKRRTLGALKSAETPPNPRR
ncbi:MAG: gamma-glutamylcyclotransferase family protein [Pseudomonadota bacterium]